MPSALLCLTVFYTALLSVLAGTSFDAAESQGIQAEPITPWRGLSIVVTLLSSAPPRNQYLLHAKPVLSCEGHKVLYDVNATFGDVYLPSIWAKPVTSYVQTDGFAVMDPDRPEPGGCLYPETGPYAVPPINAIARALMNVTDSTHAVSDTCTGKLYSITANDDSFSVCVTDPGRRITITGNDLLLDVSYADHVEVESNGGAATGCKQVSFPIPVTPIGKSLLTGSPSASAL
ncbi:unnamed protein product [Hyaloperonospora brassicae]|uniref:Uncharacterized protein n=1 Tax=Hyaloperonospora brassicae TaxID=162125 RepID=A0AAV0TRG5_HYABA|nr:unnamed protein product [Hyaloperonospora brassicae]